MSTNKVMSVVKLGPPKASATSSAIYPASTMTAARYVLADYRVGAGSRAMLLPDGAGIDFRLLIR